MKYPAAYWEQFKFLLSTLALLAGGFFRGGFFLLFLRFGFLELSVHVGEAFALFPHLDYLLRGALMLLGEEFKIDQVDDIGIAELDLVPFLPGGFLVMTPGFAIRRAGIGAEFDIINLRRKSVLQGYIQPGPAGKS